MITASVMKELTTSMWLLFSFVFCCAEPVLTRTKLLSILNKGRRKHDHIEKRQIFFLRNNYWNNRVGKNVIYFLSRKKESDYDLSFKVTFFNTSNVHHVLAAWLIGRQYVLKEILQYDKLIWDQYDIFRARSENLQNRHSGLLM